MKLIRYGKAGEERTGVCIDGINYDTSALGVDYDGVFFATNGIARLQEFIKENAGNLKPIAASERIGAPIALPSKLVCIGLNYADHAKETNAPIPPEPIIFLKSTTAIVGPYDDIMIPRGSEKTDWEVELAVVIGKRTSYVNEADANDYIAGYVLHNDVSERAFQLERNGTWDKGKGCDTFAPLGPYLVTPDEIADLNSLRLWLKVNDQIMQDGHTSNLIFNIPFLVSYVSQFMTLLPGDVISTGTPAGVGMGFKPSIYLKPGDVCELGIDNLGVSKQKVVAYKAG
jgi:2-keto-4-pentenoate hydratase/2-oxohepta-3-ene-1,7-dioic acid hydratase in catechol pathway